VDVAEQSGALTKVKAPRHPGGAQRLYPRWANTSDHELDGGNGSAPIMMSMIGLADRPATAVLPMCSTELCRTPRFSANRFRSPTNDSAHSVRWGRMWTGSSIMVSQRSACGTFLRSSEAGRKQGHQRTRNSAGAGYQGASPRPPAQPIRQSTGAVASPVERCLPTCPCRDHTHVATRADAMGVGWC
jgi:hypothetical protein